MLDVMVRYEMSNLSITRGVRVEALLLILIANLVSVLVLCLGSSEIFCDADSVTELDWLVWSFKVIKHTYM